MKKTWKKYGIRVVAGILCFLMVFGLVMSILPNRANAVMSLNRIETIKSNQAVFTILEIVPDAQYGSIGYYADGQEPFSNWPQKLAALTLTQEDIEAKRTVADLRKAFMEELFADLSAKGLINAKPGDGVDAETYPLSRLREYTEYFPWDVPADMKTVQLKMKDPETVTDKGTFREADTAAGEKGDFSATTNGIYDEKGDHVQNVVYFVHKKADERKPGDIYYNLLFVEVTDAVKKGDLTAFFGVALYRASSDGTYFEYEGTLMENNSTFRVDTSEDVRYFRVVENYELVPYPYDQPTVTSDDDVQETEPEESTEATTEPTEESTEATTEPTEESTEATTEPTEESTEATTEPTEESTEATTESTEESTEATTESTEESTEAATESSESQAAEQSAEIVSEGETTEAADDGEASNPSRIPEVINNILYALAVPASAEEIEQVPPSEENPEENPEVNPEENPEIKPEENPENNPEENPEIKPEVNPENKTEEDPAVNPVDDEPTEPEESQEPEGPTEPEEPEGPVTPDFEQYCYAPVCNAVEPYRQVVDGEKGYFRIEGISYKYEGTGRGTWIFVPDDNGEEVTIVTQELRVDAGYVNNDWLLRYVFDVEAKDLDSTNLQIQVVTKTPDQTHDIEGLFLVPDMVNMIVLTAPQTEEGPVSYGNVDITDGIYNSIQTAVSNSYCPLIVDARLLQNDDYPANLVNLARYYAMDNGKQRTSVYHNIYTFKQNFGSNADNYRPELITNLFHTVFKLPDNDTEFAEVLEEINRENEVRENDGREDFLSTNVHMGTAIRAIINFKGNRKENKKDSIRVLDIEPSGVPRSSNSGLKDTDIRKWLPEDSILQTDYSDGTKRIVVDTMSTAEFIGSIEDISETYDLVYIGASLDGFNLKQNGLTNYNDDNMDGLIYTNIGDIYLPTYSPGGGFGYVGGSGGSRQPYTTSSGLLARDYKSDSALDMNYANTYRFSGNDITEKKLQELEAFADTGRPVIIADALTDGGSLEIPEQEFCVTIYETSVGRSSISFGASVAHADGTALEGITDVNYLWKRERNGAVENLGTGTGSTFDVSADDLEVGDVIYAVAYLTTTSLDVCNAKSNTLNISSGQVLRIQDSQPVSGENNNIPLIPAQRKNGSGYVEVTQLNGAQYQWYIYNNGTTTEIRDANAYRYRYSKNTNYICKVTYNGNTYWSQTITRGNQTYISTVSLTSLAKLTVTPNQDATTLSASVTLPFDNTYQETKYAWYRVQAETGTQQDGWQADGATYTPKEEGMYYCVATVRKVNGNSNNTTITTVNDQIHVAYVDSFTVTAGAPSEKGTIGVIPSTNISISDARVDSSSVMYKAMNGIIGYDNVMSASMAGAQKETVQTYLNLSYPVIKLADKPEEYDAVADLAASLVPDNILTYRFHITNPTDANPAETRYTVKLYIDQNGDGNYVEKEALSRLSISRNGSSVDNGTLQTTISETDKYEYTLQRSLGSEFSGAVSWKLVVEKVGDEAIHTSVKGYTYIKPDKATQINVLQIFPPRNETINLKTNSTFKKWYDAIQSNYVIDVDRMSTTDFNNNVANWRKQQPGDPDDNVAKALEKYNMLVIGFGDAFAQGYDLDAASAEAINGFIDSGKAVLFTHDITSSSNVKEQRKYEGHVVPNDIDLYWGFNFNTIVRDRVALDRYGVTNKTYGGNTHNNIRTDGKNGPVADGYKGADLTAIQGSGYSIAYAPKSARQATVPETQGITNYALLRGGVPTGDIVPAGFSRASTDRGNRTTTKVTQTNQGQITQFPFPLDEEITVSQTHEQYYQLNMNSDDIVVWYCLGGTNYAGSYNDVVNGYYIYNKGNVTYSGAGHQFDNADEEAKLFINTMIAAFRVANSPAIANFVSGNGVKQTMMLVPVQYSENGEQGGAETLDKEVDFYFTLEDPNLTSDALLSVDFYWIDEQDNKKTFVPAGFFNENGQQAFTAPGHVNSNVRYRVVLPQDVLDELTSRKDTNKVTIGINVYTEIDGKRLYSTATMDLMKMGLLALS